MVGLIHELLCRINFSIVLSQLFLRLLKKFKHLVKYLLFCNRTQKIETNDKCAIKMNMADSEVNSCKFHLINQFRSKESS